MCYLLFVSLRTCIVSCQDLQRNEHSIEVTADSLYEAVAQGLRVFRHNAWVEKVGRGQTMVSVIVKQPEVRHTVRVQEFGRWLASQGRTPAEVSLKNRIGQLLGYQSAAAGANPRNRDK